MLYKSNLCIYYTIKLILGSIYNKYDETKCDYQVSNNI